MFGFGRNHSRNVVKVPAEDAEYLTMARTIDDIVKGLPEQNAAAFNDLLDEGIRAMAAERAVAHHEASTPQAEPAPITSVSLPERQEQDRPFLSSFRAYVIGSLLFDHGLGATTGKTVFPPHTGELLGQYSPVSATARDILGGVISATIVVGIRKYRQQRDLP